MDFRGRRRQRTMGSHPLAAVTCASCRPRTKDQVVMVRSFPYAMKRHVGIVGMHEWVTLYTIEGRDGIIDIFDADGKPVVLHEVWQWADSLKKKDAKVRR